MTQIDLSIHTSFIKLDQLLKLAEIVSSGGESKFLISEGFVKVDNVVELQRGRKIKAGMSVECTIPDQETYKIFIVER